MKQVILIKFKLEVHALNLIELGIEQIAYRVVVNRQENNVQEHIEHIRQEMSRFEQKFSNIKEKNTAELTLSQLVFLDEKR